MFRYYCTNRYTVLFSMDLLIYHSFVVCLHNSFHVYFTVSLNFRILYSYFTYFILYRRVLVFNKHNMYTSTRCGPWPYSRVIGLICSNLNSADNTHFLYLFIFVLKTRVYRSRVWLREHTMIKIHYSNDWIFPRMGRFSRWNSLPWRSPNLTMFHHSVCAAI